MNDILLNQDKELEIVDGDLVIGESDSQHIEAICLASKGEYKRNPEIGANLKDLLSEDSPRDGIAELKRQIEYDGAKVRNIIVKDGNINIDCSYTDGQA